MGELADRARAGTYDQPQHLPPRHPDGWEPGATYTAGKLVATVDDGAKPGPDALSTPADICRHWGYDPDAWEVERTEHRTYPIYQRDEAGQAQPIAGYYARAVFRPRSIHLLPAVEVDDLVKRIKARPRRKAKTGGGYFLPIIADLQVGKPDGDGTEGTMRRWEHVVQVAHDRARKMRPERIIVPSLGDLVEGCSGHYAQQEFGVELTRRDQLKVLRQMLAEAVALWSTVAPVDVYPVPGNHGENRKNGKSYTALSDNDDVAVWEVLAEAWQMAGRDDVTVHVPYEDMTRCVDLDGLGVAMIHGHQARTSGAPQQKLWKWWQAQAAADTPAGRCQLLLSGHYHHESVLTPTRGRTHIQVPALDGGSEWWTTQTGMASDPGMTMLEVRDGVLTDYHVEWCP